MFGFWEAQEDTPPPPSRSAVFVMRNGRYEPQNLMPVLPRPDILDFDGFVARRGASAGYRNVRPPDMRQANLLKNPVSVRRDATRIVCRGGDDDQADEGSDGSITLHVTFDALTAGTLSVHLLVTEVERIGANPTGAGPPERRIDLHKQGTEIPDDDQVSTGKPGQPAPATPLPAAPPLDPMFTHKFGEGLGLVYKSPPIDVSSLDPESLAFDYSKAKNIPIAVRLQSDECEDTCIQFSYLSLTKCPSSPGGERSRSAQWTMQIFAQKLQFGMQCFVLHDVFGVTAKQSLEDVEPEGGNSDCVICLSEPRDTAVLPCRHMCFCSYCAGIVRLQCDRCPVCRQKVASLLQFKRDKGPNPNEALMGGGTSPTSTSATAAAASSHAAADEAKSAAASTANN